MIFFKKKVIYFSLVIALCKFLVIMIFCNQDISKTKLGQVIEDNE